jgi:hypothetical protein
MSKKNRKPSVPISGPFTPILNSIHDSQAYTELSGNAAKLYSFLVRTARTVAVRLGAGSEYRVDFDYTYSEAEKRGFSDSTFKRAIRELWAKGIINVIVIGGRTASKGSGRMPSRYQLSGNWQTYGTQWTDRSKHEANPWANPSEPKLGDMGKW